MSVPLDHIFCCRRHDTALCGVVVRHLEVSDQVETEYLCVPCVDRSMDEGGVSCPLDGQPCPNDNF